MVAKVDQERMSAIFNRYNVTLRQGPQFVTRPQYIPGDDYGYEVTQLTPYQFAIWEAASKAMYVGLSGETATNYCKQIFEPHGVEPPYVTDGVTEGQVREDLTYCFNVLSQMDGISAYGPRTRARNLFFATLVPLE